VRVNGEIKLALTHQFFSPICGGPHLKIILFFRFQDFLQKFCHAQKSLLKTIFSLTFVIHGL
jgi:hypothetical protein